MENSMERTKKTFSHRLNWIDVLMIVFVVLLVVFIAIKYYSDNGDIQTFTGNTVRIEYTVQIYKVGNDVNIVLNSGDEVFDMQSKVNVGVLASHIVTAYKENVLVGDQSEIYEIIYSDYYSTIELKIVAEAEETDHGFYVNGTRIAVESLIDLRIAGLEAQGKCISIEIYDQQ